MPKILGVTLTVGLLKNVQEMLKKHGVNLNISGDPVTTLVEGAVNLALLRIAIALLKVWWFRE